MQNSRRKSGQGMTEYIIVIAIVAIGAIAIIGLFGKQIKWAFHRIGAAISGAPAAGPAPTAESSTESGKKEGMNTFDSDAGGGQQ